MGTKRKVTEEDWEAEARTHGHSPRYYNDSECGGCAKLRGERPELAATGLAYVNRKAARMARPFEPKSP